jgi:hypothetical protein
MLDLENRVGWPTELRLLIDRYPRVVWPTHTNLGALARFWLEIHDGFRSFSDALGQATVDWREGRVTHDHFRSWFAPQLQTFLSHLNGHHQIEDRHFFPLFRAAEPRLRSGFEVLENDHHVIHASMDRLVKAANAFLRVPPSDTDRLKAAGDDYAIASERLIRMGELRWSLSTPRPPISRARTRMTMCTPVSTPD